MNTIAIQLHFHCYRSYPFLRQSTEVTSFAFIRYWHNFGFYPSESFLILLFTLASLTFFCKSCQEEKKPTNSFTTLHLRDRYKTTADCESLWSLSHRKAKSCTCSLCSAPRTHSVNTHGNRNYLVDSASKKKNFLKKAEKHCCRETLTNKSSE